MKLTPAYLNVIRMVADRQIKGTCERYVWRFTDGHCAYTGYVKKLEAAGYVSISYYSGGNASVDLTDKGRELQAGRAA